MSHPRRLALPSSRSSTVSRPKSLVVQVLTRNGQEAEAHSKFMEGTPGSASNTIGSGSPAQLGLGLGLGSPASSVASSPSASPSPIRSPASNAVPLSPASNGSVPSPPKTPAALRIAVPSPGPVGGAAGRSNSETTPEHAAERADAISIRYFNKHWFIWLMPSFLFICIVVCVLCVVSAPPPNYSVLPALERIHRYVITGTLQQSLFGVVKLAFDRMTRKQVAIKISRRDLSQASQARSGVTVLENVKREAQVMRYLLEHRTIATCQQNMILPEPDCTLPTVPNIVSGMSEMDLSESHSHAAGADGKNADMHESVIPNTTQADGLSSISASSVTSTSSVNSSTDMIATSTHSSTPPLLFAPAGNSQQAGEHAKVDNSPLCEGANYICDLVDELEDEYFHYLISEFVPGGDLYSILTTFPSHRLTESQARFVFRQIVVGVKHLHDNHIAHLDLSLENVCLDANESIKIIDFGVAALHPLTPSTATSNNLFVLSSSSHVTPLPFSKPNVPGQSVLQSFLCKPIQHLYNKPGKVGARTHCILRVVHAYMHTSMVTHSFFMCAVCSVVVFVCVPGSLHVSGAVLEPGVGRVRGGRIRTRCHSLFSPHRSTALSAR